MVNASWPDVRGARPLEGGPPPLREAILVGPAEEAMTPLLTGLARAGLTARWLAFTRPDLSTRLLSPRPDLLIVDATSPMAERAACAVIEPVLDGLRALSVPVLAACGVAPVFSTDLAVQVDDVLFPPHDVAEALARATLILRRRGDAVANLVTVGNLTVDVEGFRAWLSGRPVTLTYTEFQLLRLLLLNRGKVLTRQVLLNKIWGYDYLGGLRTVDVHIRRLRAKLEAEAPHLIETVRHVGYRIGE